MEKEESESNKQYANVETEVDLKKEQDSKGKEKDAGKMKANEEVEESKKGGVKKIFTTIINVLATPFRRTDQEENPKRGNWANPVEFILACLGYAIGLGNIWRFPYIVYEHGGGTFLFVYWIIFFLVAFPAFFLELTLGQFTSRGPIAIFRNIIPAIEGLGYATLTVQIFATVYYNAIFTYALFYTGSSMQTTMPWQTCGYEWSSELCFALPAYKDCVGDEEDDYKKRWYVKGECYNNTNMMDGFFKKLDLCIYNSDRIPLSSSCKVKLDFDFTDEHLKGMTVETMLNRTEWSGRIFLVYDSCLGAWTHHEGIQEFKGASQKSKFRLDLIGGIKGDPDNLKQNEIMENLRNFTNSKWPVSKWVETFCQSMEEGMTNMECYRKILRPVESFTSEEYFKAHLDHPDANIYDMKGFFWPIPLVHILSWVIISLAVVKGPQWMGKVVYVTAVFPIIMMFILVIFAATLDGHTTGVKYYLKTNFCKLKNPKLWLEAMGQIFFSLSIGGGGLMTLASYNKFHNDVLRDSLIVAFGNCLFSFVGGFGIFGMLGFMANSVNSDIEDVLRGSSGSLAFVTLAQATAVMPAPQLWAILFFLMLAFLAVDSEFAMLETVLTFLFDEFIVLRKWKVTTVVAVGIAGYLLGLPCVSRYGNSLVGLIDGATFDFLVPLCTVMELIAVAYIYGIKNFALDISLMLGYNKENWQCGPWIWNTPIKWYFIVTLASFAPLGVAFLFIMTVAVSYILEGTEKAILEVAITWSIAIGIIPFSLICMLLVNLIYRRIPCSKLFTPKEEWGPALNEHRGGRYKLLEQTPTLKSPSGSKQSEE